MLKLNLIGFSADKQIETMRVNDPQELKAEMEKRFEGQSVDISSRSHSSNVLDVIVNGQKKGEVEVIQE
jgi:hypothetical protein